MENDFMKRGYLLPEGCKDLIDVLKLKPHLPPGGWFDLSELKPQLLKPPQSFPLPPITGEIIIPEGTSVLQLAALLGRKPFRIVADLMDIGVFANVNQLLDFETISKVARKYGYTVRKAT
jgi:Translation initiation factor IF-2, N-terminal region